MINGRRTLSSLKFIIKLIRRFFSLHVIMDSTARPEDSTKSDEPPFDPRKPSRPISYPIKKLEDLGSGSYFDSFHYPFNKSSVPLPSDASGPFTQRPRLLVCHDMAGGYIDDKWVQGGSNPDAYAIWHWHLMDVFVYFSHSLVTLPPPCWTNTAHAHGVKVLGTFITEWDEGRVTASKLLATKDSAKMYAERLKELAVSLGFDGWLLNMEVELSLDQIPNLKEFVSYLTQTMHASLPGSLVIWYDSVTKDGNLNWQNELNDYNKPFFDLCDGIFVNYTWEEDYPKRSAAVAGERRYDVYMGIDVFGRNTFGGGQWNTNVALDLIKKDDVSAAIFAPGWVYETKQKPDFQIAQNRWWGLVEKSWGIQQHYPKVLPFYSNFDQGHGYHISVDGLQVMADPWNNISCQSFQPILDGTAGSGESSVKIFVNFKDVTYDGGANITFEGSLEDNYSLTTRLFHGKLPLGDQPLHISYSVKSNGNSLVGLALEFDLLDSSTSILLAAGQTLQHLSNKFDKVITPQQVIASSIEEDQRATGWTIQESSILMDGYTLRDINVICYRERKPGQSKLASNNESTKEGTVSSTKPSAFHASLGHISIRSSAKNMDYPPASAWEVEGKYISWVSGLHENKNVSLKILWSLKPGMGDTSSILKYNIYVEETLKGVVHETDDVIGNKYIGVSRVSAFYVSNFSTTSNISSLKFIIQVCGVDGSSQPLDKSPSFLLAVQR